FACVVLPSNVPAFYGTVSGIHGSFDAGIAAYFNRLTGIRQIDGGIGIYAMGADDRRFDQGLWSVMGIGHYDAKGAPILDRQVGRITGGMHQPGIAVLSLLCSFVERVEVIEHQVFVDGVIDL